MQVQTVQNYGYNTNFNSLHSKNIIRKGILGLTTASALVACSETPFTKIPEENIEPLYQKTIDMLVSETNEYLNDSTYHIYKTDTVRVPWTFTRNPKAFLKNLQRDAKYKVPKVTVGSSASVEVNPVAIAMPDSGLPLVYGSSESEVKPKFIEPKAAISNEFFTKGSSNKMYIPVTYLGKPNPELDTENTK